MCIRDRHYVGDMVKAFRARRDFLLDRLAGLDGLVLPRPEGAFYLFPDVSHYFGSVSPTGRVIEGADELAYYLLEDAHVALVPGEGFGAPKGLRISYAASMDDLREAADRLDAALKALA